MPFDEEELDPHGECAAEINRLGAELEQTNEAHGVLVEECARLRAALNAMREQFVKDRDAAQSGQCFGFASQIQTYINDVDRVHQQPASSSTAGKENP